MENKKTREEHLAAWKSSGLNKADYSRKSGIAYCTFKGWVYKSETKEIEWEPIQIKEEQEESKSFFELRLGGRWKIEMNVRI